MSENAQKISSMRKTKKHHPPKTWLDTVLGGVTMHGHQQRIDQSVALLEIPDVEVPI